MRSRALLILEWLPVGGVLVGTCLPWIVIGNVGLSGISMASVDLARGDVPWDVGVLCLAFALAALLALLLGLKRSRQWTRIIPLLVAAALLAATVPRVGIFGPPHDHAAQPRAGVGLHMTAISLTLWLVMTVASVRRRRVPIRN